MKKQTIDCLAYYLKNRQYGWIACCLLWEGKLPLWAAKLIVGWFKDRYSANFLVDYVENYTSATYQELGRWKQWAESIKKSR